MTTGPALACPSCKRTLGPESWIDAQHGACFRCRAEFEFIALPALTAARAHVAAQAAMLAEDSVCFFHAENRAEAVCESCGRLLCPVCAVPFGGQKICPTCIAATKTSAAPHLTRGRILFDGIALVAAGLPLLIWPVTLITAPFALGMVIYGWKQPGSLVRGPSRARFVIAGLLAVIQIGVWVAVGIIWAGRR